MIIHVHFNITPPTLSNGVPDKRGTLLSPCSCLVALLHTVGAHIAVLGTEARCHCLVLSHHLSRRKGTVVQAHTVICPLTVQGQDVWVLILVLETELLEMSKPLPHAAGGMVLISK